MRDKIKLNKNSKYLLSINTWWTNLHRKKQTLVLVFVFIFYLILSIKVFLSSLNQVKPIDKSYKVKLTLPMLYNRTIELKPIKILKKTYAK